MFKIIGVIGGVILGWNLGVAGFGGAINGWWVFGLMGLAFGGWIDSWLSEEGTQEETEDQKELRQLEEAAAAARKRRKKAEKKAAEYSDIYGTRGDLVYYIVIIIVAILLYKFWL